MTKTTVTFCVKCMSLLYNGEETAALARPYISITVADPP